MSIQPTPISTAATATTAVADSVSVPQSPSHAGGSLSTEKVKPQTVGALQQMVGALQHVCTCEILTFESILQANEAKTRAGNRYNMSTSFYELNAPSPVFKGCSRAKICADAALLVFGVHGVVMVRVTGGEVLCIYFGG